ncbi:MAG: hypothetical protein V1731_00925 [Candidatus Aenigmatarchaeota archaeon]
MKGITPVIALVMLMLITVGMVGMAYTWFSGMLTGQTEKSISVPPGGIYCYKTGANNRINVAVMNSGAQSNLLTSDFTVYSIDGNTCNLNPAVPNNDGALYDGAGAGLVPGNTSIVLRNRDCTCAAASGSCTAGPHTVIIGSRANVITQTVVCK